MKLKSEISNYLENGGKDWADFEIGLGRYTEEFSLDTANDFLKCYDDAQNNIIEYMNAECQKFDASKISKESLKALRDNLFDFYQELHPDEKRRLKSLVESDRMHDISFNFVSFNYTNVLDQCVKLISDEVLTNWSYSSFPHKAYVNPAVIHIHGTPDYYPLLGVNDSSQIANQELLKVLRFADILIKPQSVKALNESWHHDAETQINNSQIICIFFGGGVSLGLSDKQWWEKILKWLSMSASRHMVIFWYNADVLTNRSHRRYFEAIDAVKDKIFESSNYKHSEYRQLDGRIHVVLNTEKVLKFPSQECMKSGDSEFALL